MSQGKEKIVLTGSSGFIGSHLKTQLLSSGYEVHCLRKNETDFTNVSLLHLTLKDLQPSFVIHVAGSSLSGRSLDNFESHYENNILPALCIARAIPTTTKLSLFFGSCEEYGGGETPFKEEQNPHCFSSYGWAKISALTGVSLIAKERGLAFSWLRPFLTFGPGQKGNLLIPAIIRGCLAGDEIPLTLGEQTRDFIYIDDLCRMIMMILQNPEKANGEILNLASGKPRTIREVTTLIRDFTGRGTLCFGKLPYRTNEAMSFYGSNEKFTRLFGAPVFTAFERALAATVKGCR